MIANQRNLVVLLPVMLLATTAGACHRPRPNLCGDHICISDAGMTDTRDDAPVDAPIDAPIDSGPPCGVWCTGDTSQCDLETHTCVECLSNENCTAEGLTQCSDDHTCVECLGIEQCPLTTAAVCDTETNICTGCANDDDCERFDETPICDVSRGVCVECTGDTEDARCGTKSCRRSDGVCTDTEQGSVSVCGACEADSECMDGSRCITDTFVTEEMTMLVGTFCFADQADLGSCGNLTRPYSRAIETVSVDGISATYCVHAPYTSCAALADSFATDCETAEDCGVDELDDGYCAGGLCTTPCVGNADCASLISCNNATDPGHCE